MKNTMSSVGISRWRQVGEALVQEMDQGLLVPGDKLPAEPELAERFGVARQTVRRALSHLRNEGLIDVQLGRGTFISEKVFKYRISSKKTFEENLLDSEMTPSRKLLDTRLLPATKGLAEMLLIEPGAPVCFIHTLNQANGAPVVIGRVHFPVERMPGIESAFDDIARRGESFSISDVLQAVGVPTFQRSYIRLTSRLPTSEETEVLELPGQETVVETRSVSNGADGLPVFYSVMSYRGGLVEFFIGSEAFSASEPA